MTRKDYILIARALRGARIVCTVQEAKDGVDYAALNMVTELSRDNPRFDRDHFLAVVRGEKALTSRP